MNKGDKFGLFDFRSHPRVQQAFSLVELLIVISIFTVLLSLLFPGLKKTVYLAKNAECMTRLKNINLVLNLYAHDFNDYHLDHEGRAKVACLPGEKGQILLISDRS